MPWRAPVKKKTALYVEGGGKKSRKVPFYIEPKTRKHRSPTMAGAGGGNTNLIFRL